MGNNIGAALGLLGGAVATGLGLRELRRRENEKQGLEAFQRQATDQFIRHNLENGTLDPTAPGVRAFLKKVYKDDEIVNGMLTVAQHTFQSAEDARKAIFSPYKTLPKDVGPTVYMPDVASPQEIGQEYQRRIQSMPAMLAIANPKAYNEMAKTTAVTTTSRQNTMDDIISRGRIAAEKEAGTQRRFNEGEERKDARAARSDVAALGRVLVGQEGATERLNTSLKAQQAASFQEALVDSVKAAGDRLPAGVTIPEIAEFYLTGKASPALQQKLGPNFQAVKAKAAAVQATQQTIANLKLDEAFTQVQEAFNAAKRSKRKMSESEQASLVDGYRADMALKAVSGMGGIPQELLIPTLETVKDTLPVYYNGEVFSVRQLRAAGADGDESAALAANNAIEHFQKMVVQASGTEGIETNQGGTGETAEQVRERLSKGLPPPAPAPTERPVRAGQAGPPAPPVTSESIISQTPPKVFSVSPSTQPEQPGGRRLLRRIPKP